MLCVAPYRIAFEVCRKKSALKSSAGPNCQGNGKCPLLLNQPCVCTLERSICAFMYLQMSPWLLLPQHSSQAMTGSATASTDLHTYIMSLVYQLGVFWGLFLVFPQDFLGRYLNCRNGNIALNVFRGVRFHVLNVHVAEQPSFTASLVCIFTLSSVCTCMRKEGKV